jgi:AraC-like DNA-binding protein
VSEPAVRHEARIGSRQLLDLVDALAAIGIDTAALCREVGLDTGRLQDAESAPAAAALALLDAAERRTRDPWVGLHAGEHSEPRGPLAFLLMSCSGLEEGFRQAARFAGLTISTLRLEVESAGSRVSVVYQLGDEGLARHRHFIDYLLLANLRSVWRAAGERLPLREVRLRLPDPGDDAEARAFGCPVHFAQRDTRWTLDARELARVPRLASPLIAEQIERFAAALFARLAVTASLRVRVADAIRKLLASGVRADRAGIARQLGMSDRTLQRGLEEEATSFRQVRDAVLWEVVESLLSNPSLKIEAVALSTGFADAAAFSKAFKRRAGCTPTAYRQRLLARGSTRPARP